jgi:hypothetical protein
MTQAISSSSVTSFATEIAELLIQNETVQSDSDSTQRDAARATYLADAQKQIDALHDAASSTETGALVGAAFSVASGSCAIGATALSFAAQTTNKCDTLTIVTEARNASYLQSSSKAFSDLAGPAKALIGDVPADDDKADAKHYEMLAEQAKWQASDATTDIDKADKLGDKILDIVQSLNQAQDSATNAVIGRI